MDRCIECKKAYRPQTLKKYGGICGRCYKKAISALRTTQADANSALVASIQFLTTAAVTGLKSWLAPEAATKTAKILPETVSAASKERAARPSLTEQAKAKFVSRTVLSPEVVQDLGSIEAYADACLASQDELDAWKTAYANMTSITTALGVAPVPIIVRANRHSYERVLERDMHLFSERTLRARYALSFEVGGREYAA